MRKRDLEINKIWNGFRERLAIVTEKAGGVEPAATAAKVPLSTYHLYLEGGRWPCIFQMAYLVNKTGDSLDWLMFGDEL